ncbi:MAG: cellulase family glycosylhydrolase [Acidimicrobiales bacterium]
MFRQTVAVLAVLGGLLVPAATLPAAGASVGPTSAAPSPESGSGLHVVGNEIQDADGVSVIMHGVNVSGPEYACVQGWGIFDSPGQSSAASISAMEAWHINFVRIGLNEDCWLGINGVAAQYSGSNYRKAIVKFVDALNAAGIYVELEDMWNAPGAALATYQDTGPDEDHSPAMWTSMARTFADNPDVILSPSGETELTFACMEKGCDNEGTYATDQDGDASCGDGCWYYNVAGFKQAVRIFRANGFDGPVSLECADYANLCDEGSGPPYPTTDSWLSYLSDVDTLHPAQIVAEVHVYGLNECDTTTCFAQQYAPILAAGYPLLFGETGETYNDSDPTGTAYISSFLSWTDANDVGAAVWTWDDWGCPDSCELGGVLIGNYTTFPPLGNFGTYVYDHFTSTWPADP